MAQSWTQVSLCAYLIVEPTSLWGCLAIQHRREKTSMTLLHRIWKFSCFPQTHSWRHPSWMENSVGSELDLARLFGTCGWSGRDSWLTALQPRQGTCPASPQKETDCKLGGPGRKPEACLGWLKTWKDLCGRLCLSSSLAGGGQSPIKTAFECRCWGSRWMHMQSKGFLSSLLEQGKALDGRGGFHDGMKGLCGPSGYRLLPVSLYRERTRLCSHRGSDAGWCQLTGFWSLGQRQGSRTGSGRSDISWHP